MKSLAILLTNNYQTSYGGIGPFVKNLDAHLAARYQVQYFSLPASIESITFVPHRLLYFFYLLTKVPQLRKFDMILSHAPEGSYVVSLFQLPFAHVFHGNGNPVSKSRFWYGSYFGAMFEYIQKKIFQSALICYTVGETLPGAKKMVNPISHQVSVKPINQRSGFVFAGRLENGKRVDELIRIYSELDEAERKSNKLFIAGKGSLKDGLEKLASDLGVSDQVLFLGNLPNQELIEVISTKKLMLMASENEGFPMSIAEALSVGVPIVSTAVGDIPSFILADKNGELLSKDFIRPDYIFAMSKILKNYATYSQGAIASSKVFDAAKIAEGLEFDLNSLIGKAKLASV